MTPFSLGDFFWFTAVMLWAQSCWLVLVCFCRSFSSRDSFRLSFPTAGGSQRVACWVAFSRQRENPHLWVDDHRAKSFEMPSESEERALAYLGTQNCRDPIAVIATLKELGAMPDLTVLIEGESIMNDGVHQLPHDSCARECIAMSAL